MKAPGFGDRKKEMLRDIAVITGAKFVSEELGHTLDSVELTDLGSAKKVLVTKENTIIVEGKGTKTEIKERHRLQRHLLTMIKKSYRRD
ncbi:MAG: 60 kDa chaperonin 1 [candidate division WS6 bacterium GW2011_GWE1_36_69]|nr:MAG: 60 kDa chaperonin 1 [candidate division WS6 bacterium GW2011_GWE1_36_69]